MNARHSELLAPRNNSGGTVRAKSLAAYPRLIRRKSPPKELATLASRPMWGTSEKKYDVVTIISTLLNTQWSRTVKRNTDEFAKI